MGGSGRNGTFREKWEVIGKVGGLGKSGGLYLLSDVICLYNDFSSYISINTPIVGPQHDQVHYDVS